MNRETEAHFSNVPYIEKPRSKFKRPNTHKTTLSASKLVPILVDEILPGDTVKLDMSSLIRMTTPIFPVMDNAYVDFYYFFVPTRLVWDHWKEFWGENNSTHWEQPIDYEIPKINTPVGGFKKGSLADYFGIPTNVELKNINHLPFRGYCQIVNDWFRDQNLKNPVMFNKDETTLTGKNKGEDYDYVTDIQLGADCYTVAKFHDYFTSALPSPQKGPSVNLPLGKTAPVTVEKLLGESGEPDPNAVGKQIYIYGGSPIQMGYWENNTGGALGNYTVNGLAANLEWATASTINELRQAFAVQRFYEAQARGGSRYIEFLRNIFGVTSPDARLQRAEYLGGKRVPINMAAIYQNSATDSISPQGNSAGYSVTADSDDMFTHSFVEHGYLYGLAVIRTDHTYQQGLERMWSRSKFTDFYLPQFSQLGEQAILNKEIYAQGTAEDEEAFGYQEAWADYRYKPNRISGAFRSNYETTLDSWHYGDDYESVPRLSSEWIDETMKNVDRTLTVQSDLEDQFICDFYFDMTYTRIMPVYSVPGLLDHH